MNPGNALSQPWTAFKSVFQSGGAAGTTTTTTICFSRPLASPHASSASRLLDPASLTPMVAAFAADGVTTFGAQHADQRAFTIGLLSGTGAKSSVESKKTKLLIHGILMSVAWALLFPLGVLTARHR
jgi:hypothetical protein